MRSLKSSHRGLMVMIRSRSRPLIFPFPPPCVPPSLPLRAFVLRSAVRGAAPGAAGGRDEGEPGAAPLLPALRGRAGAADPGSGPGDRARPAGAALGLGQRDGR